jgi:tetratricopeptide (TPR) repeat protein
MLERAQLASGSILRMDEARRAGRWDQAIEAMIEARAAQPYVVLTRDFRGMPFESPTIAVEAGQRSVEQLGLDTDADLFMASRLAVDARRCALSIPGLDTLARAGFHWSVFDLALDPALVAAECLLQEGDRVQAFSRAMSAVEAHGATVEALAFAVAAAEAMPEQNAGPRLDAWRSALEALHDPFNGAYALARAHLMWGNPQLALEELDRIAGSFPTVAVALHLRAEALAALGQSREALELYEKALAHFPAHAFATERLNASLEAELKRRPDDAGLLSLAAEHAYRQGRRADALALLARARGKFSGEPSELHRRRELMLATTR